MPYDDEPHSFTPPSIESVDRPPLQRLGILECFDEAWNLYRRFFWMIAGLQFGLFMLSQLVGLIPSLAAQMLLMFLVTIPLGFGYNRVLIRFARGEKPHSTDWQVGYRRYGQLIGMILSFVMLFAAAAVPLMIVLFITGGVNSQHSSAIGLFAFAYFIGAALLSVYAFFVIYVLVDIPKVGVMESYQIGVDLVKGNWSKVLGLLLILLPLGSVGAFLFSAPRTTQLLYPDTAILPLVLLWLLTVPGALILAFGSLLMNRAYVKLRAINGYPEPPDEASTVTVEDAPDPFPTT